MPSPLFIKCGHGGLDAALRKRKALVFYGDTRSDREAARIADVAFWFRENDFHARETFSRVDVAEMPGREWNGYDAFLQMTRKF